MAVQWLPWSDAAIAATGSAAATRALTLAARAQPAVRAARAAGRARAARAAAAWTRELAVMFMLYALWQLAGSQSLGQVGGAVQRGADLARFEHSLGIPSEAAVQQVFLGNHGLLRLFNFYYVGLHVAVTGVCLVWIFARHRDRYPMVRNALAGITAACLLVALVPVAPPRLVPGLGLVDTGRLVGPTVYPATARPGLDQLSAMPSVHVAWAIVVAGAFIYVLRSRWRWLAALYPMGTVLVVIATGNHYWADGFVSLVLCGLTLAALAGWTASRNAARPAARTTGQGRLLPVGGAGVVGEGPAVPGLLGRRPVGHGRDGASHRFVGQVDVLVEVAHGHGITFDQPVGGLLGADGDAHPPAAVPHPKTNAADPRRHPR